MKRMRPDDRRQHILDSALELAENAGRAYYCLTREQIAEHAGVTAPLINHYFESINNLRKHLVSLAQERRCLRVMGQAALRGDLNLQGMDRINALNAI